MPRVSGRGRSTRSPRSGATTAARSLWRLSNERGRIRHLTLDRSSSVKDKETDRLAREVAALTGETLTDVIRTALAERLARERRRRGVSMRLADRLMEIGKHCAALPDYDTRSPDEIVGYDETGMWR
jgi:antitoxin VapB